MLRILISLIMLLSIAGCEVSPNFKDAIKAEVKTQIASPEFHTSIVNDLKLSIKTDIITQLKTDIMTDLTAMFDTKIDTEIKPVIKGEVKTEVDQAMKSGNQSTGGWGVNIGVLKLDGLIALIALIPLFLCLGFLKYSECQKINMEVLFTDEKPNETLVNLKMLQIWSLFECKPLVF